MKLSTPMKSFTIKTLSAHILITLLFLGLLFFPKGGIKIADSIPLTWGYLLLVATAFILSFSSLSLIMRNGMRRSLVLSLLTWIPFQLLGVFILCINGIDSIGMGISFIFNFYFIPVVFLLIFVPHLDRIDMSYLFSLFKKGVLFIACFGIFQFFYKISTQTFFEIPFLTVNYDEAGMLETTKCIDRGNLFKLISTYNNGNIYGVSVLMLLPLYCMLEKNVIKKSIIMLSLILTLSRTVWAGVIIYEILSFIFLQKKSFSTAVKLTFFFGALAMILSWSLTMLGFSYSFLFDASLGGRVQNMFGSSSFSEWISFFPEKGPFHGIEEMVYLSVLKVFGIIGLLLFVIALTTPIVLTLLKEIPLSHTPLKKNVLLGALLYLIVAAIDGGILYIPIFVFYFFLMSLLLSSNDTALPCKKTLDIDDNTEHHAYEHLSPL